MPLPSLREPFPITPNYATVGTRRPRIDASAFALGTARYATDMAVPGMLYCRLLYAQQAPARITRIDAEVARRLPGVEAVVTAADAPAMPATGMSIAARDIFARDEVRTVADVIAAVAAVDDETARRAVELIEVAYEELPGAHTLDAACEPSAPLVHPGKAGYAGAEWLKRHRVAEPGNVATHFRLRKGDVAAARARAHVVVEGRFQTQRMEHFSMEPHAAVVNYDPAAQRVTLWASTGKPFRTIIQMGELLRLPMNRISAVYVPTGGAIRQALERGGQPAVPPPTAREV
ncbi:MAG TPA: molybdopterin cofactor-binding domain-containing protein [bacterium]|nr:molybdopterin cofactor-binding domain-containing protein [bacterium]